MITILGLMVIKIQKISIKINKTPTRIELVENTPLTLATKPLMTDLTFDLFFILSSIRPFFIDQKLLQKFFQIQLHYILAFLKTTCKIVANSIPSEVQFLYSYLLLSILDH